MSNSKKSVSCFGLSDNLEYKGLLRPKKGHIKYPTQRLTAIYFTCFPLYLLIVHDQVKMLTITATHIICVPVFDRNPSFHICCLRLKQNLQGKLGMENTGALSYQEKIYKLYSIKDKYFIRKILK